MSNNSGDLGGFGIPGQSDSVFVTSRELFWGGDNRAIGVLWGSGNFSGAIRDAGNDPTSVLRAGLLLGKITSSNLLIQWDSTATDGSQNVAGILDVSGLKATDYYGQNAQRFLRYVMARAPLRADQLLIKGAALVGHADEFIARRALAAAFHVLDDDAHGYLAGVAKRVAYKTGDYTVVAADNGTTFYLYGTGTFTLPAIQAGLEFSFVQVGDYAWQVLSAAGSDVIAANDGAANAVAFITGSQKLGSQVTVRAASVNGTLKWIPNPNGAFTATIYT